MTQGAIPGMSRSCNGINLHRCGFTTITGNTFAQFNGVALKNNSASSEKLVLWQMNGDQLNASLIFTFSQRNPLTLSSLSTVFPVIPTDVVPPGQVGNFTAAALFPACWFWFAVGTPNNFWTPELPMAVLDPGWSLAIQYPSGMTAAPNFAFWWEAVTPGDFEDRFGGQLVDPTI